MDDTRPRRIAITEDRNFFEIPVTMTNLWPGDKIVYEHDGEEETEIMDDILFFDGCYKDYLHLKVICDLIGIDIGRIPRPKKVIYEREHFYGDEATP